MLTRTSTFCITGIVTTVPEINSRARQFAAKEGWTAWNFVNTTCYKDLHHQKINVLEEISDSGMFYLL